MEQHPLRGYELKRAEQKGSARGIRMIGHHASPEIWLNPANIPA
jgi:hypothetical protein